MRIFFFTTLLIFAGLPNAIAHSGRTNASGCHNNTRTGDYHCHGGGSSIRRTPTPPSRIQSTPTTAPSTNPAQSGICSGYSNCMQMGAMLVQLGQHGRALGYFRAALRYQPEDTAAEAAISQAENILQQQRENLSSPQIPTR